MRQIYLLGEREHSTIETEIKTATEVEKIHRDVQLGCVSLELDNVRYQPELDKIVEKGIPEGEQISFQLVISYASKRQIPLIASDCLDFPEYEPVLELEKEIELIRAALKKGEISDQDPEANKRLDGLITRYMTLHETFDMIRDKFTVAHVKDYFESKGVVNLAHVCGYKHLERLSDMFRRENYDTHSIEI